MARERLGAKKAPFFFCKKRNVEQLLNIILKNNKMNNPFYKVKMMHKARHGYSLKEQGKKPVGKHGEREIKAKSVWERE